ncbi:MAG TPA: gluconokinase [Bryobacteraceae bacterium]|nr:gluconokinase [Bryobacteraceae bacterium]
MSPDPVVVTLDVSSSGVRTLLFDSQGRQRDGFGERSEYQFSATPDGGFELDAYTLLDKCLRALSGIHQQVQEAGLRPAAVGLSALWHTLLGVDRDGEPTTPIFHLFDTRSARQVNELRRRLNPQRVHERTGCVLHTSYWPAKLLWLAQTRRDAFTATERWISLGEFLFLKLFGSATASTSMVSASGLWNQAANDYDQEMLGALPIDILHLCPWGEMDQPQSSLIMPYGSMWQSFQGIPWFPALGNGACDNIGIGCLTPDRFALRVGSTGALRAVCEKPAAPVPDALFCYHVDRSSYVLGGSLSNGGQVSQWIHRNLALPETAEIEKHLRAMKPGSHGVLLLPFFAGERSPYWRSDLRAAITGINLSTRAIDLLQAALESVALRFLEIYEVLSKTAGQPKAIIASGGALSQSPAWTQMIADALGFPITSYAETEASSRGAALLAFERLGVIRDISEAAPRWGTVHRPRPELQPVYADLLGKQRHLFDKLYAEK